MRENKQQSTTEKSYRQGQEQEHDPRYHKQQFASGREQENEREQREVWKDEGGSTVKDGGTTVNEKTAKENVMNWDQIEGNWKQVKGKVKEKWGRFTDDDLERIEGKRDRLAGKIQEKYGIAKDEAEKQLKEFERNCQC